MIYSYLINLTSNKESNDFLRCLWSRIRIHFGNIGWLFQPMKCRNNYIHLGFTSFGSINTFDVSCQYKIKGCISVIQFENESDIEDHSLRENLNACIEEAKRFGEYLQQFKYKFFFDKSLCFKEKKGKLISIDKNSISFQVKAYDRIDALSLSKMYLSFICDLLTFDTLKYITVSTKETFLAREKQYTNIKWINSETGESVNNKDIDTKENGIDISPETFSYIESFLIRPYMYEDHYTLFEKSVITFAQAIWNEEESNARNNLNTPYAEQAVMFYMSALEIITQEDIKPHKCSECGQETFSIAKRVKQLAKKAIENGEEFAQLYYSQRSSFVHMGEYMSNYSDMGSIIPLLSKKNKNGTINQRSMLELDLKSIIKKCILWHENHVHECLKVSS